MHWYNWEQRLPWLQSDRPECAPAALLPQLPPLRCSTAWMLGSTDTGSQHAWTLAAALQGDWSHTILLGMFYGIHMSRLSHYQSALPLKPVSLAWISVWMRGYNIAPKLPHAEKLVFSCPSLNSKSRCLPPLSITSTPP